MQENAASETVTLLLASQLLHYRSLLRSYPIKRKDIFGWQRMGERESATPEHKGVLLTFLMRPSAVPRHKLTLRTGLPNELPRPLEDTARQTRSWHRDLTPKSIMVGVPKTYDFAYAEHLTPQHKIHLPPAEVLKRVTRRR